MQTSARRINPMIDISKQIKLLNEQESPHIYVVNKTDIARRATGKGGVIISARDEFGTEVSVTCPNTFIPIDLAEDLPKDIILRSANFLNMLRQGMLEVIPDEEAQNILSNEDALYESKRLYLEKHSGGEEVVSDDIVPTGTNARSIGNQARPDLNQPPVNEPNLPPLRVGVGVISEAESTDGVNPLIVEAMEHTDFDVEHRYNIVKQQEGKLTDSDLHYIMHRATDDKIRNWASDQRHSLRRGN
jgi:hypothetical protein